MKRIPIMIIAIAFWLLGLSLPHPLSQEEPAHVAIAGILGALAVIMLIIYWAESQRRVHELARNTRRAVTDTSTTNRLRSQPAIDLSRIAYLPQHQMFLAPLIQQAESSPDENDVRSAPDIPRFLYVLDSHTLFCPGVRHADGDVPIRGAFMQNNRPVTTQLRLSTEKGGTLSLHGLVASREVMQCLSNASDDEILACIQRTLGPGQLCHVRLDIQPIRGARLVDVNDDERTADLLLSAPWLLVAATVAVSALAVEIIRWLFSPNGSQVTETQLVIAGVSLVVAGLSATIAFVQPKVMGKVAGVDGTSILDGLLSLSLLSLVGIMGLGILAAWYWILVCDIPCLPDGATMLLYFTVLMISTGSLFVVISATLTSHYLTAALYPYLRRVKWAATRWAVIKHNTTNHQYAVRILEVMPVYLSGGPSDEKKPPLIPIYEVETDHKLYWFLPRITGEVGHIGETRMTWPITPTTKPDKADTSPLRTIERTLKTVSWATYKGPTTFVMPSIRIKGDLDTNALTERMRLLVGDGELVPANLI